MAQPAQRRPRTAPPAPTPTTNEDAKPYIPASVRLPEITAKGVALGLVLAILLGAANTYLGLKAGQTVAASIPAAVLSLAVLRLFRRQNILENNMVQTIASAGTSVASGVIFTIPALILLKHWTTIDYAQTVMITIIGAGLGILFTVPVRRALIIDERLPFPEGLATGEVLKAGEKGGSGVGPLLLGGGLGMLYKFLQGGLALWEDAKTAAFSLGDRAVAGIGIQMSPALLGVGVIVGLRIAALIFIGGAISWFIGIPIYTQLAGDVYSATFHWQAGRMVRVPSLFERAGNDTSVLTYVVWKERIRYLGVGAMIVGAAVSLVRLRKPLTRAIGSSIRGARSRIDRALMPRTEREVPFRWVILGVVAMAMAMLVFYAFVTGNWLVASILMVVMLVTGFLFSAVGGYLAGIVGSSNSPVSGITIITILVAAFVLLALGVGPVVGPVSAVIVAAVICVAASIAGDNLQDLKAGHMLGSTPWKQQLMILIGGVASAFVIPIIINVLIAGATGQVNADHAAHGLAANATAVDAVGSAFLPAPQATLFQAISSAIFDPNVGLPYDMIGYGVLVAFALLLVDWLLVRSGLAFRTPIMPVAVGIYLPVGLSVPIFAGGLAAWAAERLYRRRAATVPPQGKAWWQALTDLGGRAAILFASGLIAGEAIVGIATSFLTANGSSPLAMVGGATAADVGWIAGVTLLAYLLFLSYYVAVRPGLRKQQVKGPGSPPRPPSQP